WPRLAARARAVRAEPSCGVSIATPRARAASMPATSPCSAARSRSTAASRAAARFQSAVRYNAGTIRHASTPANRPPHEVTRALVEDDGDDDDDDADDDRDDPAAENWDMTNPLDRSTVM